MTPADHEAQLKAARDKVEELRAKLATTNVIGPRYSLVDDLIAAVRALVALELLPPVIRGPSPEALIARGRPIKQGGTGGDFGGGL